ncbi:MAG: DUF1634 domain-containing protein [Limnochordaceae bacterium]|nr:DUF1634 domain-containing protein [Limnochordaceae bacterium]
MNTRSLTPSSGSSAAAAAPAATEVDEVQLETTISRWLAAGMVISAILLAAGWLIALVQHPSSALLTRPLPLAKLPTALRQETGPAVALLGLTALALTPIVRVLLTLGHYFNRKEWSFVVITGIVLVTMVIGFFLGAAG